MHIIYRLSPEQATGKPRPAWFSKRLCFDRCVQLFAPMNPNWMLVYDGLDGLAWKKRLKELLPSGCGQNYCEYRNIDCGTGGAAFLAALDLAVAMAHMPNGIVYFVEDDYLHRPGAYQAILDGIRLGFDYVTLYDHPDKYLDDGPNPLVEGGAEGTRLYLSEMCHWKETNSTTMTFACRVATLRQNVGIFRAFNSGAVPQSFATFTHLRLKYGRRIGSCVPAYATHCEQKWLSPLVDWEEVARAGL